MYQGSTLIYIRKYLCSHPSQNHTPEIHTNCPGGSSSIPMEGRRSARLSSGGWSSHQNRTSSRKSNSKKRARHSPDWSAERAPRSESGGEPTPTVRRSLSNEASETIDQERRPRRTSSSGKAHNICQHAANAKLDQPYAQYVYMQQEGCPSRRNKQGKFRNARGRLWSGGC